jgi:hypothetical protein
LFSRASPDVAVFDGQVIEQLGRAGADLRAPRVTDHFLYFRTEAEAREAAAQLARPQRVITVRPGMTDANWLVEINQPVVVTLGQITALREEFEAATNARGASYDGWGGRPQETIPSPIPL